MKKNIVFLLILIPIIWISCDGMGHQTIDFRKIENLMPQHLGQLTSGVTTVAPDVSKALFSFLFSSIK